MLGCNDYGQLTYRFKLPKILKENSGIAIIPGNKLLWFVNDSGNKDHLYGLDSIGKIKQELNIKNAKNNDWEDLTSDENGNIYIGDFGNNRSDRKNLVIYKVSITDNAKKEVPAEKIEFYYPEQTDFSSKKKSLLYDVEAFFYFQDHFYLFTRNRSTPFNGKTFCYKIPATPGKHPAQLMGSINICDDPNNCQITSAAISASGKQVVLLTYDTVWLLSEFINDNFTKGALTPLTLKHRSQKESVCFEDENTLLISDEENHSFGRNLYSFKLPN
jgi:hypothetical protein